MDAEVDVDAVILTVVDTVEDEILPVSVILVLETAEIELLHRS